MLTDNEKNLLHLMMLEDTKAGYRAKIILLKDEGYTVPQIRKMTNHHDHNIRKWIHHRFNEKGIDGIISKKHNHKQHKFNNDIEKQDSGYNICKSKIVWFGIFHMVITCTGWLSYV